MDLLAGNSPVEHRDRQLPDMPPESVVVMARSKAAVGRSRPDRAKDIELYWANRRAAARTPRAQAAVEWDRTRVEASKLPPGEEAKLWRDVMAYLAQRRQQATREHGP